MCPGAQERGGCGPHTCEARPSTPEAAGVGHPSVLSKSETEAKHTPTFQAQRQYSVQMKVRQPGFYELRPTGIMFRDHSPALNTPGELPWGPAPGMLGFQAKGNIPWLSPASYNLKFPAVLSADCPKVSLGRVSEEEYSRKINSSFPEQDCKIEGAPKEDTGG